jgi:hypothetical protein
MNHGGAPTINQRHKLWWKKFRAFDKWKNWCTCNIKKSIQLLKWSSRKIEQDKNEKVGVTHPWYLKKYAKLKGRAWLRATKLTKLIKSPLSKAVLTAEQRWKGDELTLYELENLMFQHYMQMSWNKIERKASKDEGDVIWNASALRWDIESRHRKNITYFIVVLLVLVNLEPSLKRCSQEIFVIKLEDLQSCSKLPPNCLDKLLQPCP